MSGPNCETTRKKGTKQIGSRLIPLPNGRPSAECYLVYSYRVLIATHGIAVYVLP